MKKQQTTGLSPQTGNKSDDHHTHLQELIYFIWWDVLLELTWYSSFLWTCFLVRCEPQSSWDSEAW